MKNNRNRDSITGCNLLLGVMLSLYLFVYLICSKGWLSISFLPDKDKQDNDKGYRLGDRNSDGLPLLICIAL